jgi:hypothetical protein
MTFTVTAEGMHEKRVQRISELTGEPIEEVAQRLFEKSIDAAYDRYLNLEMDKHVAEFRQKAAQIKIAYLLESE